MFRLVCQPPAVGQGALDGMPYAAKDIFATRGRQPTCGLDHGIDIGCSGDGEALRRSILTAQSASDFA